MGNVGLISGVGACVFAFRPYTGQIKSPYFNFLKVPYDIDIPDNVLDKARDYSLKDLLDSPSFQCFIVSALANRVRNSHLFDEVADEADEFLTYRLNKLVASIPHETRRACFDEVGRIFRERKENR